MTAVRADALVRAFPCQSTDTHARGHGPTVVLRGPRHARAPRPVAPRPVAPRPAAPPVVAARPVAPVPPSTPTGLGYPPPTAYPPIPVPASAALVPAGLNTRLSGIFPVEVPPSSGFPLLDRALARGRWVLACEPETRGGRHAARGR
jgi:hypothetical protein